MHRLLGSVRQAGLTIARQKEMQLIDEQVVQLCQVANGEAPSVALKSSLTSGPCWVLELVGEDAVLKWLEFVNKSDSPFVACPDEESGRQCAKLVFGANT